MYRISFVKKLITCILAGLVIGASAFRISITYFRTWETIGSFSIIPFLTVLTAIVYAVIWQAQKKITRLHLLSGRVLFVMELHLTSRNLDGQNAASSLFQAHAR